MSDHYCSICGGRRPSHGQDCSVPRHGTRSQKPDAYAAQLNRIENMVLTLLSGERYIMAKEAELQAALAAQGVDLDTLFSAIDTEFVEIKDALEKANQSVEVDLQPEIDLINARHQSIVAATEKIRTAVTTEVPPTAATGEATTGTSPEAPAA